MPGPIPLRAVFFDIGETILDESEDHGRWADWLGVPRHSFFALLGAVLARGQHHMQVFEDIRPGFDIVAERALRAQAGQPELTGELRLYPDARACLAALRARGLFVGVVGNQPPEIGPLLRALDLPADLVAASGEWGVHKPDAAFFARVVESAGAEPDRVAYVGDRLDNDVLPSAAAGLVPVFLRRGPWGYVHAGEPAVAPPALRVDSLEELPDRLASGGWLG
jgi:FMN phosphatase YigB (HAD superfamily)